MKYGCICQFYLIYYNFNRYASLQEIQRFEIELL